MFKEMIKNFYILSFILFNIQSIQSLWCCKEDTTVNTKFDATKDAVILKDQKNPVQSSSDALTSQASSDKKLNNNINNNNNNNNNSDSDNNSVKEKTINFQEFLNNQDIHKRIRTSLEKTENNESKHNDETLFSPRSTEQVIASEFILAQTTSGNKNSNNSQKMDSLKAIPSAFPTQGVENNHSLTCSLPNKKNLHCSLFFIATTSDNQSNNEQDRVISSHKNQYIASNGVTRYTSNRVTSNDKRRHIDPNPHAVAIPTIDESLKSYSFGNTDHDDHRSDEVNQCIIAQQNCPILFSPGNSSNPSIFNITPEEKKDQHDNNDQEANPMPHQAQDDKTPESF